ncbi:hypothetical protein [Carboxylicivirga marina]|nr:hypothetical protein [uncultured Carboxylicivirga sp.]
MKKALFIMLLGMLYLQTHAQKDEIQYYRLSYIIVPPGKMGPWL